MYIFTIQVQNSQESKAFLIITTENGGPELCEMVMNWLSSSQYCLIHLMLP